MQKVLKIIGIGIGIIAGIVLIGVMKGVQVLTGNDAYVLLFNFDYIPIINELRPVWLFGYVFHFITCIGSVVVLYYILKSIQLEQNILPYVLVFTIGGGILFFLTGLSDQPPAANDWRAWIYWTLGHAVFGIVVGVLIRKWLVLEKSN